MLTSTIKSDTKPLTMRPFSVLAADTTCNQGEKKMRLGLSHFFFNGDLNRKRVRGG